MLPYYERNGVTLYHGEAIATLRALRGDAPAFDALVTDPPYSSGGLTRGDRMSDTGTKYLNTKSRKAADARDHFTFTGDNRDQRSFALWCALWLGECAPLLRIGSPVALFADWRQVPITTDALQAGGFVWRGLAVWHKPHGFRPVMGRFATSQAEFIVWGSHGPMPYAREGVGCLKGVFTHALPRADKLHMTGKPTALMRDVVAVASPGATILDPFAGSGTTLAAAMLTGRRAVGIELDERYAEVAARRLDQIAAGDTIAAE